jgi:hypothetical protein
VTTPDETPAAALRFRPKRLLHWLWTLPLAAATSVIAVFIGAINICGVSGCTGAGFGVSYGDEYINWLCAAYIAAAFTAAIGGIPCMRPSWVFLLVGAIIGIAIGAWQLDGWLALKYETCPGGMAVKPGLYCG